MANKSSVANPAPPQPAAKPVPVADPAADSAQDQALPEAPRGSFFGRLLWATPSWLVSMVVHAVLLLVLAVIQFNSGGDDANAQLIVDPGDEEALEELPEEFEDEFEEFNLVDTNDMPAFESDIESEDFEFSDFDDPDMAAIAVEFDPLGFDTALANEFLTSIGSVAGQGLEGRGAASRAGAAAGGTRPLRRRGPRRDPGSSPERTTPWQPCQVERGAAPVRREGDRTPISICAAQMCRADPTV